jgi:hypothetical protein
MKKHFFTFLVLVFPLMLQAKELEVAEISEDCLYEAQKHFSESLGYSYGEYSGLVTDGGGYGVFEYFIISVLHPVKGQITYRQGKLSAKIGDLNSLIIQIAESCGSPVSKQ